MYSIIEDLIRTDAHWSAWTELIGVVILVGIVLAIMYLVRRGA